VFCGTAAVAAVTAVTVLDRMTKGCTRQFSANLPDLCSQGLIMFRLQWPRVSSHRFDIEIMISIKFDILLRHDVFVVYKMTHWL
jgi:hypothetical protein